MTRLEIKVDTATQCLEVHDAGKPQCRYRVSTSRFGNGSQQGSYRTPLGEHIVRAKIGSGLPPGSVFVGRRPTGEVYSPGCAVHEPNRDWILSRILWLSGKELGKNRLGSVDTMRRYIYIHGTAETHLLGQPASIGCIRMANEDVIELFDMIPVGCSVAIF